MLNLHLINHSSVCFAKPLVTFGTMDLEGTIIRLDLVSIVFEPRLVDMSFPKVALFLIAVRRRSRTHTQRRYQRYSIVALSVGRIASAERSSAFDGKLILIVCRPRLAIITIGQIMNLQLSRFDPVFKVLTKKFERGRTVAQDDAPNALVLVTKTPYIIGNFINNILVQ